MITLADCLALDAHDPLAGVAQAFEPGPAGTIFLDANSMGALPKAATPRLLQALHGEWSAQRRHAWTVADWLDAPQRIGAAFAPLLGAQADELIATDNTTLNLTKLALYALALVRPQARRRFIVCEREGFPTDAHVVQGIVHHGGGRWALRPVDDAQGLAAALGDDVALVLLSHADYRSSARWDMAQVNAQASAAGARVLWDLSHSAGAVPVDLAGSGADFAVACGYKYLCGGPGAPALAYIRRDLQDLAWPALPGWLGHAERMNFRNDYQPARGMLSLVSGTMPVLQNAVMETAAHIWSGVSRADLACKHQSLSVTLCRLLDEQCAGFGVRLSSPADYAQRGGHVAFSCPGGGLVCEALLADGVVASFRAPDVIRFGLSALTLSHADLWQAVARLRSILADGRWRQPRFASVSV